MSSINVALYEANDVVRARVSSQLMDQGLAVYGCRNATGLAALLRRENVQALLLWDGKAAAGVVDEIRPRLSCESRQTILVQGAGLTSDERLRVLRSGADLCLSTIPEPRELAALVRAQVRRLGGAEPPSSEAASGAPGTAAGAVAGTASPGNDGPWMLLYQGWVLAMPTGQRVNLTGLERSFFASLLNSPQRELSRDALLQAMPGVNPRTVNVAISRLRKKVQALGMTLPLHTVHGMGYVFVGELASTPSS